MTHTLKLRVIALFFAFAVAATPAQLLGGGGTDGPPPKLDEKLDLIQKQLKSLAETQDKQFKELTGQLAESFEAVAKDMAKLKKDIKQLKEEKVDQALSLAATQEKIKLLEDSLAQIQSDMAAMKSKVSLYPPQNGGPSVSKYPADATCKVMLINNTTEEVVFILNEKVSVRVPPLSQMVRTFTPGYLTYVVMSETYGMLRTNSRNLVPNDVFIIRVG